METTAANHAISIKQHYDQHYALHLKHLKLNGLRPKTIEAYLRAIRRIGVRFESWSPCPMPPIKCCAASGNCTATRYCCSPAGKVASSAQRAPERTSIPVASRVPCTKWSTPAA